MRIQMNPKMSQTVSQAFGLQVESERQASESERNKPERPLFQNTLLCAEILGFYHFLLYLELDLGGKGKSTPVISTPDRNNGRLGIA